MKNNKYVVITGASSGIGRSMAKVFAGRGFNIVVVARRESLLQQLKDEIVEVNSKIDVIVKSADLSIPENAILLYNSLSEVDIQVWINNAGIGYYGEVSEQPIDELNHLLNLNINSLTILSSLFVRDYHNIDNTQLINISSAGGYTIVPTAVTYCASKFFVNVFTEGLAKELLASNAKLRAKVLAPAATKTEFGQVANRIEHYDYDASFGTYHTSDELAEFALKLFDSDNIVGFVDRESFSFEQCDGKIPYANNNKFNQKVS